MVSSGTSRGASLKHQESPPKATLRYKHYNGDADPTQQAKVRLCEAAHVESNLPVPVPSHHTPAFTRKQKPPSQHLAELSKPAKSVEGLRPRPKVQDLSNISDFSTHVRAGASASGCCTRASSCCGVAAGLGQRKGARPTALPLQRGGVGCKRCSGSPRDMVPTMRLGLGTLLLTHMLLPTPSVLLQHTAPIVPVGLTLTPT